jgi:NAD+ synthase
MSFNAEKAYQQLIDWIKEYFAGQGEDTIAVLGMSGGKDSLIAAKLCADAIGSHRVLGVMMPNGIQNDIQDAIDTINYLGINGMRIDIGDMCQAQYKELEGNGIELTPLITTNVPARMRMVTLYSVAAANHGRVVCTSNESETYVGYSTKWGDGVGDFAPLKGLVVREILAIGDYLGLPERFLYKEPADGMTGKTDQDILGFTYEELDSYIRDRKVPEKVETLRKIKERHLGCYHKRGHIPVFYYYDPDDDKRIRF